MKKLNRSRILLVVSGVILFILSCKKDKSTEDENFLKDAKTWYQKTTANTETTFKSDKSGMVLIKQDVQWESAKQYKLDDGSEIIGVPVSMKSANELATRGSYLLLISKSANTYKSSIVFNEEKDHFNSEISIQEIQTIYKNALNASTKQKNSSSASQRAKLSSLPSTNPEPHCTEWYLETTYYDSQGNIIQSTQTFLFTECDGQGASDGDGGGSGGDGDGDTNCSEAESQIQGDAVSIFENSSVMEESATTRRKMYSWTFLKNSLDMWSYTSNDVGTHKKVNGEWVWDNLQHTSIGRNGFVLGATISVNVTTAIPTIGIYNAGITLYYTYEGSMLCKNFPISTSYTGNSSSPVWNVNN